MAPTGFFLIASGDPEAAINILMSSASLFFSSEKPSGVCKTAINNRKEGNDNKARTIRQGNQVGTTKQVQLGKGNLIGTIKHGQLGMGT